MKKKHLLLLSLLAGVMLALAWPRNGFAGLMFIAFIPLLYIEDYISRNRQEFHRFSVMVYTYPGFLVWNSLTTYWIWNSTEIGAVGALIANSFFMAAVLNIYSYARKFTSRSGYGYFILPLFWISFEYWHLNWDMSWPWLNLGNAFASVPEWVQFYEYTGASGGTLWVLLVNIAIYKLLISRRNNLKKEQVRWGLAASAMLLLPLVYSWITYINYSEEERPCEVIVVQPNIDPYTEQYTLPPSLIIDKNLELADSLIGPGTDFIVCPESAIQEDIWEHALFRSPNLQYLKRFVKSRPGTGMLIGASTRKQYFQGEEVSLTARKFIDTNLYYDAYNTVFYIHGEEGFPLYHKSKLTPAVEKMPFPRYMKFLEDFAIDLGGTIGSLGTDDVRKVFYRPSDSLGISAAICYESIYGEFFGRFARNGAQLMFITTNDGWWGNTPGHRQHFIYSRLRAVETRRSIARSANTGISAFINQRGDILQESGYWVPAVLKETLNANDRVTFYAYFGDYIARISSFVSVMLLLIAISMALRNKKKISFNGNRT